VDVKQETKYPWEGDVKIHVDPVQARNFTIYVRIPGWTGSQVMAGDLYRFLDTSRAPVVLKINGRAINPTMANGYAKIVREWKAGDTVELSMPMPVRRVLANPQVKDDADLVALERGPLMYCSEWPDNNGHALNVVVPDNAPLRTEFRKDLLNGITVISGNNFTAIPYYAWANRGMGEMAMWMPRHPQKAITLPTPLPSNIAKVESSGGVEKKWTGYNDQNDSLAAVYDGFDPITSADESHRYFRMRPPVGQRAWVEYDFKAPQRVSSASVYFADDKRFCKMPSSWRITYKDGDAWKPVESSYSVAKDQFNSVTFAPVTASAVRLEVEPQTIHYATGMIGPPGANFLQRDIDWREFGIIELRVK
jgi:uncharacterized protein